MKLLAIDGNSMINRAFYGVAPLTSSKGVNTGAIYGFLNIYLRLLEEYKPERVCVCFDVHAKTFRHTEYEDYKAQRKPMPPELCEQMPLLKQVLDAMGVPWMEAEGFEADDLLGTLARLCREDGMDCVIATGDKDSLQFIAQGAKIALMITRMGNTTTELYDEAKFAEKYCGLESIKIIDIKALMGDNSDNIPGVRGIGEKGALSLLCRFRSLDGIYENLESPDITPSVRKKLQEGRDMAYFSFKLATGCLDAPVSKRPSELQAPAADEAVLYALLSELELRTTIKKLGLSPQASSAPSRESFSMPHIEWTDEPEKLDTKGATLLVNRGLSAAALCNKDGCFAFLQAALGERFMRFISSLSDISLHDSKSFASALLREGMTPPTFCFDTELAAYLLDPAGGDYSIKTLAAKYLSCDLPEPDFDAEGAFNLLSEADDSLMQYCAADYALRILLEKELRKCNMTALLRDIELPVSAVLAEMEKEGIGVDGKRLSEFGEVLAQGIAQLEEEIYAQGGGRFNISSPKQLGEVLFERMGLPHGKKSKTGYATDADTLKKLRPQSEIVGKILDYRKLTKLKSTYVDGLSKVIAPDGRIYGTFNQTVTATGRLSSTEPNLQNIPVRQEMGAEIRRCFVPREGFIFVDADYSQIELRILAHISQDEAMLADFAAGADIHSATAAQVFGVPKEMVTPVMRSRAKAVNFGIVYGISAFSLANDIGVSPHEAREYMEAYFSHYTGVRRYMDEIKEQARRNGFVATLYGRRRYLPELSSSNFNVRSFGERVALNTPIQGTAADIIKLAMIRVQARIKRENLRARLILQVHDELIAECPEQEREQVCVLLREEMEGAARLSAALPVEVSCGENWYAAK